MMGSLFSTIEFIINQLNKQLNNKRMKKLILTLMISLTFILSINATTIDSTAVDNFPKTDEVLSVMVQKAMIVAEKTGNFIIEQSPLLLQEFYMWHIWSNIFFIILAILIYLFGRYLPMFYLYSTKTYKNYNNSDRTCEFKFFGKYGDDLAVIAWIKYGLCTIGSLILLFVSIYELIFIIIAPKLYLIQYFIN